MFLYCSFVFASLIGTGKEFHNALPCITGDLVYLSEVALGTLRIVASALLVVLVVVSMYLLSHDLMNIRARRCASLLCSNILTLA